MGWLAPPRYAHGYLVGYSPAAVPDLVNLKPTQFTSIRHLFRALPFKVSLTAPLGFVQEREALSLISTGVDFGVTQVVDSNYGVHALLRKSIFSTKAPTDGHSAIFTGPASRKLKGQVSPVPLQGSVKYTHFPCMAASCIFCNLLGSYELQTGHQTTLRLFDCKEGTVEEAKGRSKFSALEITIQFLLFCCIEGSAPRESRIHWLSHVHDRLLQGPGLHREVPLLGLRSSVPMFRRPGRKKSQRTSLVFSRGSRPRSKGPEAALIVSTTHQWCAFIRSLIGGCTRLAFLYHFLSSPFQRWAFADTLLKHA
jgi:hypothetical protein